MRLEEQWSAKKIKSAIILWIEKNERMATILWTPNDQPALSWRILTF